jgi:DNA-nicking Smr family endonuclease
MDFGKILEDWEQAEGQKGGVDKAAKTHWAQALDQYDQVSGASDSEVGVRHKKKITLQVKRKHPIQDEIDLHGLTAKDAQELLKGFITEAISIGYRKVKVIHGRGLHSEKDSVLKPMVHSWLEENKYFWELCPSDQGGSGATWIWLQKD